MSWALQRALKASDLPFPECAFLNVFATYADRETKLIHPKVQTVSDDTRLSVSQIYKMLRSLQDKGCLVKVRTMQNNIGVYQIDMDAIHARARHPGREEPRREEPGPVRHYVPNPCATSSPDDEPVHHGMTNRGGTSSPDDEPVRHETSSTSSRGDEPLIRKEPLLEPLSSPSPKLGGVELVEEVEEEWDHPSHPDAAVVRFAAAVAASKRWGPRRVPDRQACENLVATARRTIREAGKREDQLLPVLASFAALVQGQKPSVNDKGPGFTLQEAVRLRLKDMPDAPAAPEPAAPPPKVAEPKAKPTIGYIVTAQGGVIAVTEDHPLNGRTLHRTRREAESEALSAAGVVDVTAPRETQADLDRRRALVADLRDGGKKPRAESPPDLVTSDAA